MSAGLTTELQAQERARIKTMEDLMNLDFDEIYMFYRQNEQFRPTNDPEDTIE